MAIWKNQTTFQKCRVVGFFFNFFFQKAQFHSHFSPKFNFPRKPFHFQQSQTRCRRSFRSWSGEVAFVESGQRRIRRSCWAQSTQSRCRHERQDHRRRSRRYRFARYFLFLKLFYCRKHHFFIEKAKIDQVEEFGNFQNSKNFRKSDGIQISIFWNDYSIKASVDK